MRNKEYLEGLSSEKLYNIMHWLWFEYGVKWTDTRQAIIAWLEEEHAAIHTDDPGPTDGLRTGLGCPE